VDYRTLGRTGLKVSQLGFGGMRFPMIDRDGKKTVDRDLTIPMIHRAFEAGVNYIDTATMYCWSDSETVIGEALKGWRDRVIVSTKNPYFGQDEKEWRKNLETSLRRLDIQCIDVYHHHGVNRKKLNEDLLPRVSKWMLKAAGEGLVKHIACSFHDNDAALRELIDTGYPSVITLQYNLLDRQLEGGIAHAKEKNVGVVVMGPVGGGRLGEPSDVLEKIVEAVKRVPELAMRFVLANPNISMALSGMSTIEQVEENVRIASDAAGLTPADLAAIDEHLKRLKALSQLYCTGCNYCLPCPADVAIPKIFERFNRGRVYGQWDTARKSYDHIGADQWDKGNKADACTNCGACEAKCPQNIAIRKQLREAHEALACKR
jgi:predicted aldo/keto reductase-like oxidoreductase